MRSRKLQERDGVSPADKSPLSSRRQFGEVIQEPCNRSFAQGSHFSFSRFDLSDLLQWSRFAGANQGYACSRDNRGCTFLSAGDLHQNGQTSSLCNGFSPDWRGANHTGWKFNGEGMAHPFHYYPIHHFHWRPQVVFARNAVKHHYHATHAISAMGRGGRPKALYTSYRERENKSAALQSFIVLQICHFSSFSFVISLKSCSTCFMVATGEPHTVLNPRESASLVAARCAAGVALVSARITTSPQLVIWRIFP